MESLNIHKKLKELENTIDEYAIDMRHLDFFKLPIGLMGYELKGYGQLVQELHQERGSYKTYNDKERLIKEYKKIYLSQRKMYKRILRNLNNGTAKFLYSDLLKDQEERLYERFKFDRTKSLDENLTSYMKAKLGKEIKESNQELFKLNHYPTDYINTLKTYIGPSSVLRFRRDAIYYKDVFIAETDSHSFSVFFNEHSKETTKNSLLNMLAYLNGHPSFYFTENYGFNEKICDLYQQFDLLDMLRLRKKDFFGSKQEEPFYRELPILKQRKGYDMVCLEDSRHEILFELYHASLKQFESLPRCVFLFRVFEYGANKHYQPLFRVSEYNTVDALNYYANEIMTHRFIPLYYADLGRYINEEEREVVTKRKAKYVNFTTKLKEEIKKIRIEWSNHHFLHDKSIGEIIYNHGRNAAAHGRNGEHGGRYDYAINYKHMNDVNIFLELIARYIIETLNPHLSKIVERRTNYYKRNSNYKVFEE